MKEKVLLHVEGMDCANCAITINSTLKKEGLDEVNADFMTGEVIFTPNKPEAISKAIQSINRLGYHVKSYSGMQDQAHQHEAETTGSLNTERKFYISLVFTIPLVLHMVLNVPLLHNPVFQLLMCLPVMFIGVSHFGRSAFYSIRAGVPNMDVLIFTGSFAAFIYSIAGMLLYPPAEVHHYLFFETGATIITLVLLGNVIEQRSVKQTTSAISQLQKLQPKTAKKIQESVSGEQIIEVAIGELKPGEVVIANTGDQVPLDGRVVSGNAAVNESMLTGESIPVPKMKDEKVTGGTIIVDGNLRIEVEKTGNDTVLAGIIEMVKKAQHAKPAIQKLGDRVSAIFVPVVIGISVLTFIVSAIVVAIPVQKALMNSIAVLVISCPCAMGLATPTAVMVGIGRAARNGILFKGGSTIEQLSKVRTIVFDKTGTITTGNFSIKKINVIGEDEKAIRSILYSMEKYSSHPIAKSVVTELGKESLTEISWKEIKEDKGIGINATDQHGNLFSAGSFQMVKHFYNDLSHDIYLLKNNKLIATIDIEDEIKHDVKKVIQTLHQKGIKTILLSGDREEKCASVAKQTGISAYYGGKRPEEKLRILEELSAKNPTAMIGDGINDAPALAQATVGISISKASDAAIQSAQVILLDRRDMHVLIKALRIGELTYSTIKQNLFWAFFYNVVAIPIAAAGFLSPMIGALSMAFSDVIVIGNSLRLRTRKIVYE